MRVDHLPIALFATLAGPLSASPLVNGTAVEAQQTFELAQQSLARVEARANQHTSSTQELAALARDGHGRTVVVWQSKRQEPDGSYGIFARRFDAGGRPLGDELHVNLRAEGAQYRPAVALSDSGAAWFAWESYGQDGHLGGVVLRRFAPDFSGSTNEVLADTVRDGHQSQPALAVDAEGRALVVWTGPAEPVEDGELDPRARTVRARLFAADGAPLTEAVALGAGDGIESLPTVVAEPGGGFRVAWARAGLDGVPCGVAMRSVDDAGAPAKTSVEVVRGACIEPALDVDASGRALVSWMAGGDGDWTPALRSVELDGSLGPVRRLDPGTPGYASGFGALLLDDGTALAAWSRFGDEQKSAGLFLQRLDDALAPAGEPFRATESLDGHQKLGVGGPARLAFDARGLAIAWDGFGPEGDRSGVNLTTYVDPEALLARADECEPAGADGASSESHEAEAHQRAAEPHEPPIFTGPVDPNLAQIEASLGGPDYGFAAVTQTNLTPPDPHISAGPDHVVCVVNGGIAFYDKDGTETFFQNLDGVNGFFAGIGAANGFIFDPETLYDPHEDRFMIMANERNGNSFFLLAVSDDADPNGTWFKYRFDMTAATGLNSIDSPNFAVDDTAVYLTADFFSPDRFGILMVEKAPLLVGGSSPIVTDLVVTGSHSYGVPVTYDAGAPAQYMLEAFESFTNNAVRFHAITDPLGSPQRVTFDLSVPTYVQPENPPQGGTSLRPETFESRFWSCMYRDGSLWATHHVDNSQVRQRWYEFAMNGWPSSGQTPTLVQSGEINSGATGRTYFGSIWADEEGNAGLIYAISSPTEFIGMARSFREAGDPLGTMTTPVVMQQSTEPDFSGRWGDYSGVASDPTAVGSFWGYHEYRSSGIWRTWVGLMGPCKTPLPYCTAKVTSAGTTPAVGWTGEPSVALNAFEVTMDGGLPGNNGIAFWGTAPSANPFFGGLKCVANPIQRTPIFTFDGSGSTSVPVPLTLDDLGVTRYYQFWFRDPPAPDGTTVGLSDALEFTVCP